MLPGSAYIHIPFCRHRCGYCNFALVAGRDHLVDRFLNALENEISTLQDCHELDTLFFGGGTPSHLSVVQLARLRQIVEQRFKIRSTAEVTAECNPNDITPEKMQALTELGVNRISLGAQSMQAGKLLRLQRDHSCQDVAEAVQIARDHGIASISLDLIFAAPQETIDDWKFDLDAALTLQPDHVSTYELTFEKGTQFWNHLRRGRLSIADEDLRADMYEWAIGRLEQGSWQQYELSSFAKSGHSCRHNQCYWNGQSYLAFGPGASQFVDGQRSTNHQGVMAYMKRIESGDSPAVDVERLTGIAAARERLVIGLRLAAGVDLEQLNQEFGKLSQPILSTVLADSLVENGLIEIGDKTCRLSAQGIMVFDSIATAILNQPS